ncbi:MAG: response regulator, partial [Verrucomicrobiota bacterium]
MQILIVEDDDKVSSYLRRGLQEAGFTVDLADSVSSGAEATGTKRYDLLILDRGLPDGDGCEIVTQVRAANKDMLVILLTARDSIDDRIMGLDSGADDYVVKPFAFSELLARIRS